MYKHAALILIYPSTFSFQVTNKVALWHQIILLDAASADQPTKKGDGLFECKRSECSEKFTQKRNRSRHQKHSTECEVVKRPITFECPNEWCDKVFIGRSRKFERHSKTCRPKSESFFVCDAVFDRNSKLLRHQESHNWPTCSCSHCSCVYLR